MNYNKEIDSYCENHSTKHSQILNELDRETHLKTLAPQMLSGQLQGAFLRIISKMLAPQAILEIGTFTGYSAICLSEGLTEDGMLHTIEANSELQYFIKKYFKKAGIEERAKLYIGKAEEVIPDLDIIFDLVFIDAGKLMYPLFYDLVIDKVRSGGLILADNTLWSGKVVNKEKDADTQAIDDFNKKIQADARVENVLLPLRDGVMMIRKL